MSINGEDAIGQGRAGDRVRILSRPSHSILEVVALAEKRGSAAVAERLYVITRRRHPSASPKMHLSRIRVERGSVGRRSATGGDTIH